MTPYFEWLRAMFHNRPLTNVNVTSDVPPALTNGKGTPVGGTQPLTTAKFIIACNAVTVVSPAASKE